jgi:hypothetical protein
VHACVQCSAAARQGELVPSIHRHPVINSRGPVDHTADEPDNSIRPCSAAAGRYLSTLDLKQGLLWYGQLSYSNKQATARGSVIKLSTLLFGVVAAPVRTF